MPAGMARLTYYNPANSSTTDPDPDGSVNLNGMVPGADKDMSYNSTEAVLVNFDPSSAAASSVGGWFEGGLGFDAFADATSTFFGGDMSAGAAGAPRRMSVLQQIWQADATAHGMFTLPVCEIRDLNYWPTFYGQGDRRAYNDYCICYNDLNSDPLKGIFKDVVVGKFRDFVTTYRGLDCGQGHGTEPAVGGSPVGLAPRGTRNPKYKPLPWP